MRGINYIVFALVLITGSCSAPSQVESAPTLLATMASPTPQEVPPPSIATSTVETVQFQEPVLATKYTFPGDYLTIHDLYFIDDNNGWAVGHLEWYETSVSTLSCCKPKIFYTTNGGTNWNEVEAGITSGILNSIIFLNPMTGYAVGKEFFFDASAIVLKTDDGGKSWARVDKGQINGALNHVMTTHSNEIWSVGMNFNDSNSLILRSSDGLNWKVQKHPSEVSGELTTIVFPSETVGYAVGFVGHDSPEPYIMKTLDSGASWTKLPFPHRIGRLLDASFQDDTTGYVIGHFGENDLIASTNDGGESWTLRDFQPDLWLYWFSESNHRMIIFGNCPHTDACNNLIGLFDGNEVFPFESMAFPSDEITAVGNSLSDGSIVFVTNTKPETWDAKYETTFYRYNVP